MYQNDFNRQNGSWSASTGRDRDLNAYPELSSRSVLASKADIIHLIFTLIDKIVTPLLETP